MENNKKIKIKSILTILLIISFITANFFIGPNLFAQKDVNELNQQINDKKKEIDTLQQEIEAYKEQISNKEKESKTLKNQLAIIENQVAKIELDIKATEARIEEANLQIQSLNLQIKQKEGEIKNEKDKLAEYIRLIYQNDQISYSEVILINDSFSDFFDYLKYTEEIHGNIKKTLDRLKDSKSELEIQKNSLEEKKKEEDKLKDELTKQKSDLDEKLGAQQMLLVQTRLTQRQYQNYLYQLQLEQQQTNSEIIKLEKNVRQQLEEKAKEEKFKNLGPATLAWPVNPYKGITAYFHDPGYPFRYIFEHPAIDIRAGQGTSITAPESGYVAKIKFKGDSSYAYIMLIHSDGISTVFGHVSAVFVKEDDYVTKGQIIGNTGAMPGTVGAGPLTTGPHLHFEVRLNGIPVNPLEYLPSL